MVSFYKNYIKKAISFFTKYPARRRKDLGFKQSETDLRKHLAEQIEFLKSSVLVFDRGNHSEAKRLATVIRTLLHDTKSSKSLLGQLGMKSLLFWDTSFRVPSADLSNASRVGPYEGLVCLNIGPSGSRFIAPLDEPPTPPRKVSFEEYWIKSILIDNNRKLFSRRDLILNLTNKDGGVHIDPFLPNDYAALSRSNSLGWKDEAGKPLIDVELVVVRQIAHEVLKTLITDYPEQKNILMKQGASFGGLLFVKKKR